jgi:NAD(P)-dependent dehydrogenase (short-subunit alcohol dehydrogenase family)
MGIRFDGRVAIVTGAGNGLGRSHALALAARGAKVVVNDLGGAADGSGASSRAAQDVVELIRARGGEAIANGANVARFEEVEAMVAEAVAAWGRVDVLVNNAGILRDKSFSKMSLEDFRLVLDVHLMGSVHCSKAVWGLMQAQQYGRIVMTTSSSGMYGNFGQSNYGAAKMAVLGLMSTLLIEGQKSGIRVNALGPGALTRMTEGLLPPQVKDLLRVEPVTEALIVLCDAEAPNGCILNAQAGSYSVTRFMETEGAWLPLAEQSAERIRAEWDRLSDPATARSVATGGEHVMKMVTQAGKGLGLIQARTAQGEVAT